MTKMILGNTTRGVDTTHLNSRQKDGVSHELGLEEIATNARWWLMGFRGQLDPDAVHATTCHQVVERNFRLIQGSDLSVISRVSLGATNTPGIHQEILMAASIRY
jgi:hypothetical protein